MVDKALDFGSKWRGCLPALSKGCPRTAILQVKAPGCILVGWYHLITTLALLPAGCSGSIQRFLEGPLGTSLFHWTGTLAHIVLRQINSKSWGFIILPKISGQLMLTMASTICNLILAATDPSLPLLLCPCQVMTWVPSPLNWRRQVGTAESYKCIHLVSAFLQMIFGIWWWGTGTGTGCLVEQKSSQSPGLVLELAGRTVQTVADRVWACISPRLQRTWAKIKSSVMDINQIQKTGTLGEKVKDLTPAAEPKGDSRQTVL